MNLLFLIIIGFLFVIIAFTIIFVIILRDQMFINVPFVSTRKRALTKIIKLLNLSKESVLYDLGCGDARILIEAVRHVPGINAVGIEFGILPFLSAKIHTCRIPVQIKFGNILNSNLSQATHIYCYLSSPLMKKMKSKIKNECGIGTRIVSCDYQFPNWKPIETISIETNNDQLSKTLYLYTK